MSGSLVLPILLALAGSILFALGSATLQQVASTVPDDQAGGLRLIRRLIRLPVWWLGMVADVSGYGLQAAALAVGSLLVVQPLIVTSLLFALPLAARWSGRRLNRADLSWAAVLVVSLAVFMVVGEPTSGDVSPGLSEWLWPGLLVGLVFFACLFGAGRRSGVRKALLLGTGAGIMYGLLAGFTKTVVDILGREDFGVAIVEILGSWQLWALAIVSVLGTVIQQSSFQAGALSASMPAFTVAEPIVAVLLGIAVYGDTLDVRGLRGLVIAIVAIGMTGATIMLARTSAEVEKAQTAQLTPVLVADGPS